MSISGPIPVRMLGWIVYVVIVGAAGFSTLWSNRSGETAVRAAEDLPANHLIVPADLHMEPTDALLGRYLRSRVDRNKPITPDMVSEQPTVPPIPVGISAVVMISKADQKHLNLGKGTLVQIQRAKRPLVDRATVQAIVCDETSCSVYLELGRAPPELDAASLAGAELVPLGPLPNAAGNP